MNRDVLENSLNKCAPLLWIIFLQLGIFIGIGIWLVSNPDIQAIFDPQYKQYVTIMMGSLVMFNIQMMLMVGATWISDLINE